jgi:tRNA A37 threonylcarbamoyladenosine synthetase subunit TsaC/SUA5/YrdC
MLFLLPTDTCYWLAWDFTRDDFDMINALKWRDDTKRLAMLVEDFEDMKKYILISDEQIEFLRQYPHPWSFLWVRNPSWDIPDWMEAEKYQMISLRVVKVCLRHREWNEVEHGDPEFRISGLLRPREWREQLRFPLFLTSANLSWQPESTTIEEARKYFPSIEWFDGGTCDRPPSDIFSLGEDGEIVYLRRNYPLGNT